MDTIQAMTDVESMQLLAPMADSFLNYQPTTETQQFFAGHHRETGAPNFTATRADLIFGSNSELRAIVEVYTLQTPKPSSFRTLWTLGSR